MFDQPTQSGSAGRTPSVPSQPALVRCGICGNLFQIAASPHRPFCSQRCQSIDLGRWFGEVYGLPWEDPARPEDESGLDLP